MPTRTLSWATCLLLTASLPAWGLTVRPGQWEVTRLMEGDNVPREQREETTIRECITAEEASDMAIAARRYMDDSGCSDISVSEDDESVNASAICRSAKGTSRLTSRLTVHSYEYFTSAIESTKGDNTTIHRQESHWVAKQCEDPTAPTDLPTEPTTPPPSITED